MKAKTFENLIRKIVREEIDYSLRREIKSLKEDLRDEINPIITEQPIQREIPPQIKPNLREKIMGTRTNNPNKKIIKHKFVSDNALNDLLNETAQGDTNLNTGMSPATLSESITPDSPESVSTEGIPEVVANAVTRDYRGLMEAIDKRNNK